MARGVKQNKGLRREEPRSDNHGNRGGNKQQKPVNELTNIQEHEM